MSKSLQETLEKLIILNVNYGTDDISKEYLKIVNDISIEDYIDYSGFHNEFRKQNSKALFHIVLSVKVDKESLLVPFSVIYYGEEEENENMKDALFLKGQNYITYSYSDFLSTFFRRFNAIYGGKKCEAPRSSFKVKVDQDYINITNLRFLPDFGKSNWLKESDEEDITEEKLLNKGTRDTALQELKDNLFSHFRTKEDGTKEKLISFVDVFSNYYYTEKRIDELWYFFFNMDSDYDSGECLTRLMIITNNYEESQKFVFTQLNKIRELAGFIRSRYTFDLIRKNRYEAIKSAKAAIMSRNLSHNLGSHVMSYLKQNFSSAQEMVANGSLLEVVPKNANVACKEMPLLVGMGKFISYLQERQDYIATVSTDYIPYPSVVNFKDAIYDELNPDYRFQRHTEWQGHKPANILLQNIAKSEGLSREVIKDGAIVVQKENNILITYGRFDGLNKDDVNAKPDYDKLRKWNFSLPGGSMGRQAIFSIVENVIRNAAKHGTRKSGDSLVIRFDIINPFVDTERMESDFEDYQGKVEDLYIVTLTDNVKTSETDIESINNVIGKSFVNEGADLTASNKGIKEMIISAAWLRGIRIEERNEGEDVAPILKARRTSEDCLQYVFCVPKVKEVAIIVAEDSDEWLGKKRDEVWIKNGWYVFTLEEYKKQSKNFNFVILDKSLKSQKEEVRKISSSRFFVASEDNTNLNNREIKFVHGIDQLNSENKLKEAEEELFKELAGIDESFKISIYDKKDEKGNAHVEAYDDEESMPNKKYIYRKHNDTDKEFMDFLNSFKGIKDKSFIDALNEVQFAEGITGGNSTDRLLRHNERNLLWAYQHAHAMKTRVAIFDERIFTRITGYEMSQLKEGESLPIDWKNELDGVELSRARQMVNAYDASHGRNKMPNEILNASKEELLQFVQDNYPVSDPVTACELDKVAPLVYNKKGIDVYTLTRMDETGNRFAIWGVRFELNNISTNTKDESSGGEGDKWKSNKYGCVEKVAELSFVEVADAASQNGEQANKKLLKPELTLFEKGKVVRNKDFDYDYLSIHQGLLDKVYEIKKNMTVGEKQRITKAIHELFVNSNCDKDMMDYLPGLTIHSGRSKPNKADMPQHQPFIQYSAIENAVSDCKYTLVELLDFACYEQ